MLKGTIASVILGLYLQQAAAQAASPSIVGQWLEIDDDTKAPDALIEIREKDGVISGTIVKLFLDPGEPADPKCTKCTGKLKDQPIIGMTVIENVRHTGTTYEGGTILDPESGRAYRVILAPSSDGHDLSVTGYVGLPAFGETRHWMRAP